MYVSSWSGHEMSRLSTVHKSVATLAIWVPANCQYLLWRHLLDIFVASSARYLNSWLIGYVTGFNSENFQRWIFLEFLVNSIKFHWHQWALAKLAASTLGAQRLRLTSGSTCTAANRTWVPRLANSEPHLARAQSVRYTKSYRQFQLHAQGQPDYAQGQSTRHVHVKGKSYISTCDWR